MEPKLTKLEVVQVFVRAIDDILEKYGDDNKLEMNEITAIVTGIIANLKKEYDD